MVSTMNTRRLVPDADCLMRSQLCAQRRGGHTRESHLCFPGTGHRPLQTTMESGGAGQPRELSPSVSLTSMAALTAVSEPRLKSVPGTLLLMVAGMTHMTMQSSSYCPRASTSCSTPSYACKRPRDWEMLALQPDPHPRKIPLGCPQPPQPSAELRIPPHLKAPDDQQPLDVEFAHVLHNLLHAGLGQRPVVGKGVQTVG